MRLFSPAPLPRLGLVVAMSVALLLPSLGHRVPLTWAQAGPPPGEPKRPAYQIGSAGRFNEDWSVLRGVDLDKTDDFWDRLKFIPLSPDQNVWLTIGGQARERGEYFRQFLFGNSEPKQSDGYLLSRYRLIADLGSAGRFNEDWSVLRGVDLDKTDDFWDRLKFIPLSPDQNVWLTIGGQARERGEYFRQFLFGNSEPKQSDGYLLSRYRLIADLHVTRYFRMFAEGKSSLALDRDLVGGRTTAFVDELDLLNGFADVMIPLGQQASVTLRGGRQELIFGSQRLVGPGDFTNVPRTFEGGAAIGQIAGWTITPFWTQAVVIDKYRFNKSTSDQEFFGVFATGPLHFLPVNLDLYCLDANNRFAAFNGTTGREHRHTLGGRVLGKIGATGQIGRAHV